MEREMRDQTAGEAREEDAWQNHTLQTRIELLKAHFTRDLYPIPLKWADRALEVIDQFLVLDREKIRLRSASQLDAFQVGTWMQ